MLPESKHTVSIGSNISCKFRCRTKVETQLGITIARLNNIRHVEIPLTKLIVGVSYKLTTKLDGGKRVQAIKYKPSRVVFLSISVKMSAV